MSSEQEAQRRVARVALAATAAAGLALAGAGAIREHGLTERLTEDVDIFTAQTGADVVNAAVDQVTTDLLRSGCVVEVVRRSPQFARLSVRTASGEVVEVDPAVDWRAHLPVTLDIGQVLSLADASTPTPRRRASTTGAVALVVVALVVGAATHVGWDELSHPGRWGTEHLAVLRDPVGGLEGYRWVQYGSGVVGLAVLAAWALRWWLTAPAGAAPPGRSAAVWVWPGLLAVAAVAGCTAAAAAPDLRAAAFAGATVGGGTALAVALVGALVWRVLQRVRVGAVRAG